MLDEESRSFLATKTPSLRGAILILLFGGGLFAASTILAPKIVQQDLSGGFSEITLPGEIERHPKTRYIRRPAGIEVRHSERNIVSLPDALQRHLESIESAAEIVAIGLHDGPVELLFGQVASVGLQDDRIYILDAQAEEIRTFSFNGEYLVTFGAAGQGPGEFNMPTSLELEPSADRIWVADANRRLTRYDYAGDAPRFLDTLNVGVDVEDLCFSEHGPVIHVARVGGLPESGADMLVHTLGEGDEIESSFSGKYGSASPHINYVLSAGLVACRPQAEFVFHALKDLGEVRAFRVDGDVVEALWISTLGDFAWPDNRELATGWRALVETPTRSAVTGLTYWPDLAVLVQVSHSEQREAEWHEQARLDSFLFEPNTGMGGYVGSHLPLVVAIHNEMFATLVDNDFPRVTIYAMDAEPRTRD